MNTMGMIQFDPKNPDLESARRIVLERLRLDPKWEQVPAHGDTMAPYVEFIGEPDLHVLRYWIVDAMWALVLDGVIAPGQRYVPNSTGASVTLPWFHVTEYGRRVLDAGEFNPHDAESYLNRLRARI